MRDRKLNRLILLLLFLGLLGTLSVNRALRAAVLRRETAAQSAELPRESSAGETRTAEQSRGQEAGEAEENSSDAVNAGPEASYSPSDGGKYAEFQRKFSDTENTLSRMRELSSDNKSEAEIRSEAASELRYWETQMNALYQTLMEILPDEKAAVLSRDQQDWQKEREEKAARAAQNPADQSGGTEYTLSQAESTRARSYELLEKYRSELEDIQ